MAGSYLQLETAAREDAREVQVPVEEALLDSDLRADAEPRVLRQHLFHRAGASELAVELLGLVELCPGVDVGERLGLPAAGAEVRRAENHLAGIRPLVQ